MFNKLNELINNGVSNHQEKDVVLLFGASKGGQSVFSIVCQYYDVLGFVDNNKKVQGTKLLGKKVYAPSQLKELSFDKIIIASDYHVEIKKQLIDFFGVSSDIIKVFDLPDGNSMSPTSINIKQYFNDFIISLFMNIPYKYAKHLYSLYINSASQDQSNSIKEICWLDELEEFKVITLKPSESYLSSFPIFVGDEPKTILQGVPEVNLYHFKDSKVMTNINAVQLPTYQLVLGRVPGYPVKKSQYDAGFIVLHGAKNALTKDYENVDITRGIAILGSNDGNYYHWLIEVLSKLEFINELPREYQEYPILISKRVNEFKAIKEFINCLPITRKIIYLDSCIEYKVGNLLFINPPNYFVCNLKGTSRWSVDSNYIRKSSLDFLRMSVMKQLPIIKGALIFNRVFLARKGVIRDYNQEEVLSLLNTYGFKVFYLEDLSLFEQASLMNNAQYIVGPTGAAWTNLIFCQPGTKALCWMAEEIGDFSCFSDLASFSGVDLEYIRYKASTNTTRSAYYAAYSIDIEKIREWLSKEAILLEGEI